MKQQLESQLNSQVERARGVRGVALITALAVAREGAETVVFVYGLGVQAGGAQLLGLLAAAGCGFLLAMATAWIIASGAKFLNYRSLFRVSEILLLVIAGALLVNAVDRMIALDWLPPLIDQVWDSSWLLDDSNAVGRLLASFVGYRARPSAALLVVLALYWATVIWHFKKGDQHAA